MNKSFDELLNDYLSNSLTEKELQHFLQLVQSGEYEEKLKDKVSFLFNELPVAGKSNTQTAGVIFENIILLANGKKSVETEEQLRKKRKTRVIALTKIAVAASFIAAISLGVFLWFNNSSKNQSVVAGTNTRQFKNDVLPGGDKAVLTLADGSSIVLNDAHDGTLTEQGNVKVIKIGGKLFYNGSDKNAGQIEYNTITTPRGGQYQVELPDGSKVWINAASSLRFPTAFVGNDRRVEIQGEAYFEVAKNKSMPFIVKVNDAEVQVLGTHFNVMAYDEEASVNTTLLEGSVKFVKGDKVSMLKPGQQSQLTKDGQVKLVNDVDIDKIVAWKNGLFVFDNSDLGTVMRQLSRWYDLDVVYRTKNVTESFVGEIPRDSKLSDVFKVLELTSKIRFDIQGKKIIVM